MTSDDVLMQGRVNCEIPGADDVLVIQPRAGSLTMTANPFAELDHPVLAARGMPCMLQVNSARFDVVSIGADVLRKAAAGQHASPGHELVVSRFQIPRQRRHNALTLGLADRCKDAA